MRGREFGLRPASAGDAALLVDMVVLAVNWDADRPPVTRERVLADPRLAHYATGWPRTGDLGVIAIATDAIASDTSSPAAIDPEASAVGAAWLRVFSADDPGYGFVAPDVPELSIGVVPTWRGTGVGRALLRELVQQGAARGCDAISLSVERANRARALYLDEGFVVVAEDRDADTMLLRLAARST